MAAIAAGGKKINFDKKTITDKKSGKTKKFSGSGKNLRIEQDEEKKQVKVSSQVGGTTVYIESDAPEDQGKTFGGQRILPRDTLANSKKTKINVVSDAPEDRGKILFGEKVQTSIQYEENLSIKRGNVRSEVPKEERYINNQRQRELNEQNNQKSVDNPVNPSSGVNGNDGRNNTNISIYRNPSDNIRNNGMDLLDSNPNINNFSESSLQQQRTVTDAERATPKDQTPPLNPILSGAANFWDKTVDVLQIPRNALFGQVDKAQKALKAKYEGINAKPPEQRTFSEKAIIGPAGLGSTVLKLPVLANEGPLEGTVNLLRDPVKTTKSAVSKTMIAGAYAIENPGEAGAQVQESAVKTAAGVQRGDPDALASVAYNALAAPVAEAKAFDVATDVLATGYKAARFAGKTEIPSSDIVRKDTLQGGVFPEAKSTDEIVQMLAKADNKVVTVSPSKLTGEVAGDTRKSVLGLEDGGINVAPKGEANFAFARTSVKGKTEYTVNPMKILDGIKQKFKIPTTTTFKTQGVAEIPKNVLDVPGFRAVQEFQEQAIAGTGMVVKTKRSMIGQGELPRQKFAADQDFEINFALTVERGGKTIKTKNVKQGDILTEAGTSEIELTIARGQKFKERNFDKFFKVNGERVAVREADLIVDRADVINDFLRKKSPKEKLVSEKRILDESNYLASMQRGRVNYKSPYPSAASVLSRVSSRVGPSSKPQGISSRVSELLKPRGSPSIPIPGGKIRSGVSTPTIPRDGSSSIFTPPRPPTGGGGSIFTPPTPTGTSVTGSPPTDRPPITPNSKIRLPGFDDRKQQKKKGYNVYTREAGKRVQLNREPLTMIQARRLGVDVVDNTVARSFEVRKTDNSRIEERVKSGRKFDLRKGNVALKFVEKSKHAIDTQGEKQGLSVARYLNQKIFTPKGGFKL